MEESKNGINALHALTRAEWRGWLMANHQKESQVWLILYKKKDPSFGILHIEAVEEALCFGWIDSLTLKRDEVSRYQFFSKRKPKGNWSAINKKKALQLIEDGLMQDAGMGCIQAAMKNGMWDALNDVENLIVPQDLKIGLQSNPIALANWEKFPKSSIKAILKWIHEAKRDQTRTIRIQQTIENAIKNKRVK